MYIYIMYIYIYIYLCQCVQTGIKTHKCIHNIKQHTSASEKYCMHNNNIKTIQLYTRYTLYINRIT